MTKTFNFGWAVLEMTRTEESVSTRLTDLNFNFPFAPTDDLVASVVGVAQAMFLQLGGNPARAAEIGEAACIGLAEFEEHRFAHLQAKARREASERERERRVREHEEELQRRWMMEGQRLAQRRKRAPRPKSPQTIKTYLPYAAPLTVAASMRMLKAAVNSPVIVGLLVTEEETREDWVEHWQDNRQREAVVRERRPARKRRTAPPAEEPEGWQWDIVGKMESCLDVCAFMKQRAVGFGPDGHWGIA